MNSNSFQYGAFMNFSLRQMRAYCAVADCGSFTLAARQLHLTQSAISMLVQQLEDAVGFKLFDRRRNAVTPTEAGLQLLPLARRMLEDMRQFQEGAGDLRTLKRGVLRIAAPQLLACTWIARALAQFARLYPDIGVRLIDCSTDDVVALVRRGEAELGVGPERAAGDDVGRHFLMHVPMRIACAQQHALAMRKLLHWRDLQQESWVVYSGEFTRYLEQMLQAHNISLSMQTAADVTYMTTAMALVGAGQGVAAVPEYASGFAATLGVRLLPVQGPILQREFFVYQPRSLALSLPAQAFVQLLRQQAQTTSGRWQTLE